MGISGILGAGLDELDEKRGKKYGGARPDPGGLPLKRPWPEAGWIRAGVVSMEGGQGDYRVLFGHVGQGGN